MPDPRIGAHIMAGLSAARTVLNVGAGAGSYEPTDRTVMAVEPSGVMIAQRPAGSAPAARARAEHLPFRNATFDAAMAVLTLHHWKDWRRGLCEMRRVASRLVILTWDPHHEGFWLTRDYFPALLALDRAIFPSLEAIEAVLGPVEASVVPIPHDCSDGFTAAYWKRPEAYLDPEIRGAMSSLTRIDGVDEGLRHLADDLETGRWSEMHGERLAGESMDAGYRLIVHDGAPANEVDPR